MRSLLLLRSLSSPAHVLQRITFSLTSSAAVELPTTFTTTLASYPAGQR